MAFARLLARPRRCHILGNDHRDSSIVFSWTTCRRRRNLQGTTTALLPFVTHSSSSSVAMTTTTVSSYVSRHFYSSSSSSSSTTVIPHNNSSSSSSSPLVVDQYNSIPDKSTTRLRRDGESIILSAHSEAATSTENEEEEDDDPGFEPHRVVQDLARVAQWNQGNNAVDDSNKRSKQWDHVSCRNAIDEYEKHLLHMLRRIQENNNSNDGGVHHANDDDVSSSVQQDALATTSPQDAQWVLVTAETAERAFMTLLKCKLHTLQLGKRVRSLERLLGKIGQTPLTDKLSLRLVEANGKAGNIGRVLMLLNMRASRQYKPTEREFVYAIQAIRSAGVGMRSGPTSRNVLVGDADQPEIDNPTRWLDAILRLMSHRNVPLSTTMANRMLNCYATTGRTSKALYFFYLVTRQEQQELEGDELEEEVVAASEQQQSQRRRRTVRAKMKFRPPPKYYKVPSEARDKLVAIPGYHNGGGGNRKPKLDFEMDPHWSLPLTAAFGFANSLTHGVCGHDPIVLDVVSYNTLLKICCYRGALCRALHVLQEIMPQQDIEPDTISYNTILAGLARVGDTAMQKDLFVEMNNKCIPISKLTIEAIVDGMLNMGDIGGAITFVQDVFNQHTRLPPYTTHLKIMEFALANDLPYEAKRHVYLLQQVWRWEPTAYHDEAVIGEMDLIKKNPKLSKLSIQKLFAHFGERLEDSEFL